MTSPLEGIYQIHDRVTKRASSFDRTGGNDDRIGVPPGKTATLCEIKGAGVIRHIWFTIGCKDPMLRRNAVLRMYWDEEKKPSVESPLGDFFGQGWGESYNYIALPLCASPVAGRGLNCYLPMPFGRGAKITVENQSDKPIDALYYYVDYEQHKSMPATAGRFHAQWRRELTEAAPGGENEWGTLGEAEIKNTDGKGNYIFADIKGRGHFVGINYYVDNPGPMWYGEGDDLWLVDGDKWPGSLHGTGTEDFFNSCWCPKELYQHPYFGYARVNNNLGWLGRTHCYRFFLEDPIHFRKSLLASIEHGHGNCLVLDLCTVAYWYQREPHAPFPLLPPRDKRQNMPAVDTVEIHRWRDAWRKSLGNDKKLWGNEKK